MKRYQPILFALLIFGLIFSAHALVTQRCPCDDVRVDSMPKIDTSTRVINCINSDSMWQIRVRKTTKVIITDHKRPTPKR